MKARTAEATRTPAWGVCPCSSDKLMPDALPGTRPALLQRRAYNRLPAREAAARAALQVGLLHQAFVLMGHQVRLDLRREVHHHNHHDEKGRAAESDRHVESGAHQPRRQA